MVCQEHTISLVYRKQLLEITHVKGIQKIKVISEKDIDRKVILWVDPSRKKEFKFIGSLIEILQNEVPELSKLRKVVKDISGHLQDLGWPMKMEFNIKKNVTVTMNIKSIQVLSGSGCPSSLFLVPRYAQLTSNYVFIRESALSNAMSKIDRKFALVENFLSLCPESAGDDQ